MVRIRFPAAASLQTLRPSREVLVLVIAVVTMPANGAAGRRGYGTELIERLLRYDLGAETRLEFGPDEVHCMIAVPIGG
jgi:hypothetical protein